MKKILCILLSLCLLTLVSAAVTAQACGVAAPCPDDRDGDGVQDSEDRCISDVGPASNSGCPETGQTGGGDADGDGIPDSTDQCTTIAGTADFGGCPGLTATLMPDSDADGENDAVDRCPNQPGPAGNTGCPLDTTGASTIIATPTAGPSTNQPNPLVPPTSGPCQLTSASTLGANVRADLSLNAAVVGSLDPNQVYMVLSAVVNGEGTWYRIEAGWVASLVVNIGGQCPARIIAVGPSGFTIAQDEYDAAKGGIAPEEDCFELFNGLNFCQMVLTATANDDDGPTEGWSPGGSNVCGIGIGGVACFLIDFNSYEPEECIPEVCEPSNPQPNPFPEPNPWDPENNGAVYCKTLFDNLALPTEGEGSPYYTVFPADGGVGFGLRLPPMEPQPCLVDVYVVREEGAANGQVPVDRLLLEIEFPPVAAAYDYYLRLDGVDGESEDSRPAPSATRYNIVRLDLDGNVCITATHGDFKWCPGVPQPAAPTDLTALPTPVWPDPILDSLMSFPGTGDPTADFTCDVTKGVGVCVCTNSAACKKMAAFCGDAETTCYGNVCGCGSKVDE